MGGFIVFIIIIAAIWCWVKYIHKPIYRISMIDPVTGHVRYLTSVDGINKSFQYTSSENEAIQSNDAHRMERYMKTLPSGVHAILEMHNFIGWKNISDN